VSVWSYSAVAIEAVAMSLLYFAYAAFKLQFVIFSVQFIIVIQINGTFYAVHFDMYTCYA